MKDLSFSVVRIHSEHFPKYALVIRGQLANGQYICPRYIRLGRDLIALRQRANELNFKITKSLAR